jgi:hypothetical protein
VSYHAAFANTDEPEVSDSQNVQPVLDERLMVAVGAGANIPLTRPLSLCDNASSVDCNIIAEYIKHKDHVNHANVFKLELDTRRPLYFATSTARMANSGLSYAVLGIKGDRATELYKGTMEDSSFEIVVNNNEYPDIITSTKSRFGDYTHHLTLSNGKYHISDYSYKRHLEHGRLYDLQSRREVFLDLYAFIGKVDANNVPKTKSGNLDSKIMYLVKDESGSVYMVLENGLALAVREASFKNKSIKESDFRGISGYERKRIKFSTKYHVYSVDTYEDTPSGRRKKRYTSADEHQQYFEGFVRR